MKNISKRANIHYTSGVIGAATDIKKKSVKRTGNVIFGIILLILGMIMSLLGLSVLALLLTTPFGIATFGLLFLLIPIVLILLFSFVAVVGSFSSTSNWFLVLYKNRLLYKYKEDNDDASKTYAQIELPIDEIERCYILCE